MNRLLFIILLTFFMNGAHKSWAIGYGAGGELTYQYINDSTYRFYYKFYRACSGINENNEFSMCYRNTCSGLWYTEVLQKASQTPYGTPNGQVVDNGCPDQLNLCLDPNATLEMYREWWYTGIVTLNEPCDYWEFSVNITERDRDFLTNLNIYPLSQHNLYVYNRIDNLNAPQQSSPYFTSPLPVYACVGEEFNYNLGVIDPDGDSLVYKLIQPLSATTDIFVMCAGFPPYDLTFSSPLFNLTDNPFETNNTFSLDENTGDLSFIPDGEQVVYVAYLVEKYRNGEFIGSAMRDARLEIKDCTTPDINFSLNSNEISGGVLSNDTLIVCANSEVSFCFNVFSSDATAILGVNTNHEKVFDNAETTFQNLGTNNVTGCITFTPENDNLGFKYFIVSVKDSVCSNSSIPVVQTFKIPILVKPATEIKVKDAILCPGESTKLWGEGAGNYNWSTAPDFPTAGISCTPCDTTEVTLDYTTKFIVTSDLNNGCSNTDTLEIIVDRSTEIKIIPNEPVVLCDGPDYIILSSQASGQKPLKEIACGAYTPDSDELKDSVQLAEGSNHSLSGNMMNGWVEYWGPFYSYFKTQRMQIIYRKEELIANGIKPGTMKKIALNFADFEGVNPTFQNIKISIACTEKFQFAAPFQDQFSTGLTEVYSVSSKTLHSGWNEFEFQLPYDFDTSKNLIVQFCYSGVDPVSSSSSSGMLPIYYINTTYKSSISSGQIPAGNACASNLGTVRTYDRRPDTRFVFTEMPEADFQYEWTPNTGMDDPGASETGVFANESGWYTVTTKGRNGCEVKDSIYVHIPLYDFEVEPLFSEICEGEVVRLTARGGQIYNWYNENYEIPEDFLNCVDCDTPNVKPNIGTNRYHVVIADSFGCNDTLGTEIYVKPSPDVRILNNDTVISYGEQIRLYGEGASFYFWTPTQSIDQINSESPLVFPQRPTMYYLVGSNEEGCSGTDSVFVDVILNEPILIPNAFSPNNDGLNDYFRIENLKFYRVIAFSVFNRLGQEVYNDPFNKKGWDGNINGKPADVGTYFYYIIIENPEGKSVTYKGDVTLIR